jgi:hypothetical protein
MWYFVPALESCLWRADMARQRTQRFCSLPWHFRWVLLRGFCPRTTNINEQTKAVLTKAVKVTDLKMRDNLLGLYGLDIVA